MIARRARWRLTLGFAAVQLLTYAAFAASVYLYVTTTFDFDPVDAALSAATAEGGFAVLRSALVLAFAALAVVAPISSWMLAGLAMRPVAETLAAQRRFVDDASHEMRTPLTAIRAELELALRGTRTVQEYREACERALDAATALTEMTDDLLLASENRQDRADAEPVELAAVVRRAVALLPDGERVHVSVDGHPGVDASATAMQRAVLNLLVNARKFSAGDSLIEVHVSARGHWGVVEVADRGIGMTPIEVRRAFDRFWQADPSRAGAGSGLGLSIVREIAASLGGDVALSSEPGVGTTVRLRVPLSRTHDAERGVVAVAQTA